MFCKNCGKEIDDKAAVCVHCGVAIKNVKAKKPIIKKWWFWLCIAVVIIAIATASSGGSGDSTVNENNSDSSVSGSVEQQITYETADLRTMIDELKSNALKAEKAYQDKNIEIVCKITNFDSDGSYISVEPVNADEWDFTSVTCDIKNDEQLNFLLEKQVGDQITIKGKVTSVGELLGYTIKIAEVK